MMLAVMALLLLLLLLLVLLLLLLLLLFSTFMQDIYNYIPETNKVCRAYNIAATL
jgi:predicted PurR-regulated permease PerM